MVPLKKNGLRILRKDKKNSYKVLRPYFFANNHLIGHESYEGIKPSYVILSFGAIFSGDRV